MNVDLSIYKLAYREADTLGLAQALIARRQNEVSLKVVELRAEAAQPVPDADGGMSLLEKAFEAIQSSAEQAQPDDGTGAMVDKTA